MPDWEDIVGQRLGRMKLAPEERREVIAEVAAHLEDCYGELCDAGSPDPEGYTLAQVPDWKALGRKIRKAKEGPMNQTIRVFLCGSVTGAVAAMLAVSGLVLVGGGFLSAVEAASRPSFHTSFESVLAFAAGILTLWLYTAIRPRYGPGTKTAALAGFALWVIGAMGAANWSSYGLIPLNVFLVWAVVWLPAWIVGALAGAWFCEASERKPSPALKAI